MHSQFESLEHWYLETETRNNDSKQHKFDMCLAFLEELGRIHSTLKFFNNNIHTANVVVKYEHQTASIMFMDWSYGKEAAAKIYEADIPKENRLLVASRNDIISKVTCNITSSNSFGFDNLASPVLISTNLFDLCSSA